MGCVTFDIEALALDCVSRHEFQYFTPGIKDFRLLNSISGNPATLSGLVTRYRKARRFPLMSLLRASAICLLLATVFCPPASSSTNWFKVGSSAFTSPVTGSPPPMVDSQRIRFGSIVVDGYGNIYASVNILNNAGPDTGGITIFPKEGPQIDINLFNEGYSGNITKLVVAGDGLVYGLQNWFEVNWGFPQQRNRILRIHPDGFLEEVWSPGNPTPHPTTFREMNRIGGMAVNYDDGNLYWTTNGEGQTPLANQMQFFWRYNIQTQHVEPSPMNGTVNNGWGEEHRMFDLEYVGDGWFAVIRAGSPNWRVDAISWTQRRRVVSPNGTSNPAWGRDHITGTAYDPKYNRLWLAGRGNHNRNIMTRFTGDAQPGLFAASSADPMPGIAYFEDFHTLISEVDFGVRWWVSALAIEPESGDAWMGVVAGNTSQTLFGWRGQVLRRDANLGLHSEGTPEYGADIQAITFYDGVAYTLVFNNSFGTYSVYASESQNGDQDPPQAVVSVAEWQENPTRVNFASFRIVFSETVVGMDSSKVQVSGTAGASFANVTGSGAVYDALVFDVTQSGSVTISVPPGAVEDLYGNPNLASGEATVWYVENQADRISSVKLKADGDEALLDSKIVTAVYGNHFYVQEQDRSCGIKVVPRNPGVGAGPFERIDIGGWIKTDENGERYLDASVTRLYDFYIPAPLAVTPANLGGGSWFHNILTGAGQAGASGGTGLNNIGLLVSTYGVVTRVESGWFEVSDGNGIRVKVFPNLGDPLPGPQDFVKVTGVASLVREGESLIRALKVRQTGDIQLP